MIELIIMWSMYTVVLFVRSVELVPELLLALPYLTLGSHFVSWVTTASLLDP